MSPRYERDDVDEVRERADIVEIIGEHVRLKKAGRDWKGLCPFHQEKTPSFTINPDKQVYYCHGCGQGGTVFTFLEQVDGLSFPEAVEVLAHRYNVQLKEFVQGRKAPSPRARLYAAQEEAVARYREFLAAKDAEPVRAYLASRGITDDLVERYRVGFGGWNREALVRSMFRAGFKGEELMAAGLATREGRGIRDTFFGRLLFPIFDPSGRPVGIGGRIIPEEFRAAGAPDGPKYLNSRESPVFKKSRTLYGTNWARADVVQRKRLVLVEGYTDVIAMHASGFGEAVATCGTSLTEDHMKEISTRFGDVRIVMCLDSDAAGQAAMSRERTEELSAAFSPGEDGRGGWLPIGKGWLPEVQVANLPSGKDPADFVKAEGPEAVGRVLDGAVPLVEFLLRRALEGADLTSPDGRARAVRRGIDVLKQVGDSLMRHEYALYLADRTGVESYEIGKALEGADKSTGRRTTPGPGQQAPVALSGTHRIEREALRALLTFPQLLTDDEVGPGEDDFTLPLHRSLYRLTSAEVTEQGEIDTGRLAARVQDEDVRKVVSELSMGETPEPNVARDTLASLRLTTLKRHIVERKDRLRGLDPQREAAAYDALFEELLGLEKQKRALSSLVG